MKRLGVALGLALISAAPAVAAPLPVSQVIDLIGTAQRRVLVYVPYLTDIGFADALRAAKVDATRPGLQVILLTVPFFAAKENALSNGLALAGVPVVEAQVSSTTAYVLVDDNLFSSSQIGRVPNASDVRLMTKNDTNTFLNWFRGAASAGKLVTSFEAYKRISAR